MTTASEQVAQQMRDRIVRGQWSPGSRLPTRTQLIRELDSCASVVQEAVNQLATEGFVEVGARRLGTRVAEHPPHLSRYRLIFPYGPEDYGQFWQALEQAAQDRTTPAREYACFYGLGGHRDIDQFQAVVDEVRTRSVAGLIFASSAGEFAGTPLLDAPGIPRVAVATQGYLDGVPKVHVDLPSFLEQAVGQLAARGCRRIAFLGGSRAPQMLDRFQATLAEHGLETRNHWGQFASLKNQRAQRQVIELLLHPGQSERPDGLVIADDNLIAGATAGVAASGVSVPDELQIVAMTNFPNILPAAVPVTRIGYDIPGVLDLLTERLDALALGQTPSEMTYVPAITLGPGRDPAAH